MLIFVIAVLVVAVVLTALPVRSVAIVVVLAVFAADQLVPAGQIAASVGYCYVYPALSGTMTAIPARALTNPGFIEHYIDSQTFLSRYYSDP